SVGCVRTFFTIIKGGSLRSPPRPRPRRAGHAASPGRPAAQARPQMSQATAMTPRRSTDAGPPVSSSPPKLRLCFAPQDQAANVAVPLSVGPPCFLNVTRATRDTAGGLEATVGKL